MIDARLERDLSYHDHAKLCHLPACPYVYTSKPAESIGFVGHSYPHFSRHTGQLGLALSVEDAEPPEPTIEERAAWEREGCRVGS